MKWEPHDRINTDSDFATPSGEQPLHYINRDSDIVQEALQRTKLHMTQAGITVSDDEVFEYLANAVAAAKSAPAGPRLGRQDGDGPITVQGAFQARAKRDAQPTRDAAEGVVKPICETCKGTQRSGGFVNPESGYQDEPCPDCQPTPWDDGAGRGTPRNLPATAPDAMREVIIKECAKWLTDNHGLIWQAERMVTALSTPVPPADGTSQGRCDTTLTERFVNSACRCKTYEGNLGPCKTFEAGASGNCVYCDHEQACHSPSAIGAAEPQMLEYARRLNDFAVNCEIDGNFGDASDLRRIAQQIVATPPVRGDREAIAKLQEIVDLDSHGRYGRLAREAIAILSLPVQPCAGERGSDAAEADRYFNMAGEFGNRIQRAVEVININIGSINRSVAAELKKILDPENALSRQPQQSSREG